MSSVLSIGRLRSGQEDYYLRGVDQGADDYYTRAGEGHWRGRGADELELHGLVRPADVHALFAGVDPRTDDSLLGPKSRRSVPAFDLTLSAPKSVSLLYAFGGEGVREEVIAGHTAAVGSALTYLEEHATVTRRGRGGVRQLQGDGLVAAEFGHRTSRAGDPQLHSHVLVANLTRGADGHYGALHSPLLYANARTAGFLYQAVLRHELTARLGVEWTEVQNGMAEVAHVDAAWCRHHSRRRAEILERQAERGEHSPNAARVAALDTRKAKDYGVEPEVLQQSWEDRARAGGFEPRAIRRALHRTRVLHELDTEVILAALAGPEGLTERASTFVRRDVVRAVAQRAPQGATLEALESLTDRYLTSADAVPLTARGGGEERLRPEEQRYSTPELVALETAVIEHALARLDGDAGLAGPRVAASVLGRRPELSVEQAKMVERLLSSGAGVEVVSAKAGSGKTFALEAARAGWEAGGYRVLGTAVAGRAAQQLERDSAISSSTLDRLLLDLRAEGFAQRSVVVVDEAGMAGTRKLAELLDHAERARAKVVLVGDPHQVPAIDAGGVLRGLAARLPTIELTENRRQRLAWERAALDQWRAGDLDRALATYQTHGRFVVGETAFETRGRLVTDWWEAFSAGEPTLMLAPHRDDVELLNHHARRLMAAADRLGEQAIEVGEREFAAGDRVMTRRNDRRLGITNGTLGWVTSVDPETREVTVQTDDGHQVLLGASYLDGPGERLVHGYASTIHKGQGTTVDRTFVLGDDTVYRELGYSAASRHRDAVRFYVVEAELGIDPPHGARDEPDPVTAFERSLHSSRADALAVDMGQPHTDLHDRTLAELFAERRDLVGKLQAVHDGQHNRVTDQQRADLGRLRALTTAVDRRLAVVVRAVEADPPCYLLEELGPTPEGLRGRRAWQRGAAAIECYRAAWGVTDSSVALGAAPPGEHQRAHRDAVRQEHAMAGFVLDHDWAREPRLEGEQERRARVRGIGRDSLVRDRRYERQRGERDMGVELEL